MEVTDAPPKMATHTSSPALPRPKTLVFLDSTNESSGRVVSPAARRMIRSHVMREYRKQHTELTDQSEKTQSSQLAEQRKPQHSNRDHNALPSKHSSALRTEKSAGDSSEDTSSECTDVDRQRQCPVDSQFHLNGVTDGFAYAGNSSIDFRSYALFNHYSSECTWDGIPS